MFFTFFFFKKKILFSWVRHQICPQTANQETSLLWERHLRSSWRARKLTLQHIYLDKGHDGFKHQGIMATLHWSPLEPGWESCWCLGCVFTLQPRVMLCVSWPGLMWSTTSPWCLLSLLQRYYSSANAVTFNSPCLRVIKRKTTPQTTLMIHLKYTIFLKWTSVTK